jgi:hypothetical protein
MSLCQPDQRSKIRITVSSGNLEELYGAQASPFTIFHHQDHFAQFALGSVAFRRFP